MTKAQIPASHHYAVWVAVIVIVVVIAAVAIAVTSMNNNTPTTSSTTVTTTMQQSNATTTIQNQTVPCAAQPNFTCSSASFHNGVLNVVFGQDTGSDWSSATMQFVPNGRDYVPGFMIAMLPNGLGNNESTSFALSITNSVANASAGTVLRGSIYANYSTATSSHNLVKVADLYLVSN